MADLAEAVGQLYGLAPGDFIKERNGLAAQAKSDGDKGLADRIKTLPKPTVGVWLINQLARHEPDQLARVLGLSEALRAAQDEGDGDELRRLSKIRGQVMRDVIRAGRALGKSLGQAVSDAVAGELEQALRAALADESAAAALVSGQLARQLESTGFGGVDLDAVLAAPELDVGSVLDEPIEPSEEGLGDGDTSPARPKPAAKPPSTPAKSKDDAPKRHLRAVDTEPSAAEKRKAAAAEKRRQEQQREADEAAAEAAEAARVADEELAAARHEADETADQLEELAALLSQQRDRIRDLENTARAARRTARDADRARRHVGILSPVED